MVHVEHAEERIKKLMLKQSESEPVKYTNKQGQTVHGGESIDK